MSRTPSGPPHWPKWAGPTASPSTREDRRHISDRDLRILRETVTVKLNLEMACEPESLAIACEAKPSQATLVPENREEITTEGGLDVRGRRDRVARRVDRLRQAGISVSLFLDPDPRRSKRPPGCRSTPSSCTPANTPAAAGRPSRRSSRTSRRSARGSSGRAGAARRPRPDLSQRPADRGHRRDARVEHRPQHRRPRHDGRLRGGRAGNEAASILTADSEPPAAKRFFSQFEP